MGDMDDAMDDAEYDQVQNASNDTTQDLIILGLGLILIFALPYFLYRMYLTHCKKADGKAEKKMSRKKKAQLINQGAEMLKNKILSSKASTATYSEKSRSTNTGNSVKKPMIVEQELSNKKTPVDQNLKIEETVDIDHDYKNLS